MEKTIQKICSSIIKQYKKDKNVLGVLLFGSVVKNKFDRYSDVDIFVLLNKKGKFSRVNFLKQRVRVDIIFNTKKEAISYLKGEKNNLKRITTQMLAPGQILFERKNELSNILTIAKSNLSLKTKSSNNQILMHKYSIDDFWGEVQRDIKNKNYIAFGLDSQLLLNNIIELYLRINGEFLRQPNEMMKTIKYLDQNFANKIEGFYKSNTIKDKQKILKELVIYIFKKSKGPLPDYWDCSG